MKSSMLMNQGSTPENARVGSMNRKKLTEYIDTGILPGTASAQREEEGDLKHPDNVKLVII